ncbi:MAG: AAA family ATPase, partial [Bacteroidales bacterium]|nr:AAA family ATPase [Bacteroidales bacterium]
MERIKVNELLKWYKSKRRKPLIVWGARQVGKSYLVKDLFAKRYFKDFVYIDLK